MSKAEKIKEIKAIYQNFLVELNALKKKSSQKSQEHIKAIEAKEIDKILDKIHNEL